MLYLWYKHAGWHLIGWCGAVGLAPWLRGHMPRVWRACNSMFCAPCLPFVCIKRHVRIFENFSISQSFGVICAICGKSWGRQL